jgi:hypothetical protein
MSDPKALCLGFCDRLSVDECQARSILGVIGPVNTHGALARSPETELDVGEGRASMQEPQNFGDYKTRPRHAHERHRYRLPGEFEPPAIVFPDARIAWIFARDALLMRGAPFFFVRAEIRPQLGGRSRVGQRVQADRVEIARRPAEAALDHAQKLRRREIAASGVGIEAAEREARFLFVATEIRVEAPFDETGLEAAPFQPVMSWTGR